MPTHAYTHTYDAIKGKYLKQDDTDYHSFYGEAKRTYFLAKLLENLQR